MDASPRLRHCGGKAAVGAILMDGTAGVRQRGHVGLAVEDLSQHFSVSQLPERAGDAAGNADG